MCVHGIVVLMVLNISSTSNTSLTDGFKMDINSNQPTNLTIVNLQSRSMTANLKLVWDLPQFHKYISVILAQIILQ